IRDKINTDKETKVRGTLAGDSTYRNLRSRLRSVMTGQVTSADSGNPDYLFDIGISAASDGTLSITDSDEFEDALLASSSAIADLFNSSSGVATQLKSVLDDFIKVGGYIDKGKDNVTDRIKNIDSQINRYDERLARRERQLRTQFAKMQEVSLLLGRQSAAFSSIASNLNY
ncbi:MAG: flagellar filament capping protein FliD, partial [bacterium]